MKLIPNNITVIEQLALRDKIVDWIRRYSGCTAAKEIDLSKLEEETGIRCRLLVTDYWKNGTLVDFECVNSELYMLFLLRWT